MWFPVFISLCCEQEVPENKRRVTTIRGIVIARRNAGLNSTCRIRRLVSGVGVESLLPLYVKFVNLQKFPKKPDLFIHFVIESPVQIEDEPIAKTS